MTIRGSDGDNLLMGADEPCSAPLFNRCETVPAPKIVQRAGGGGGRRDSEPFRVLHLVGGELTVGAHRGAYWLHRGLRDHGIESSVLTTSRTTLSDPDVFSLTSKKVGRIAVALRNEVEDGVVSLCGRGAKAFSTGLFGGSVSDHPLVRSADVVNMHWVARGLLGLSDIGRIRAPVIWTLRDMWPFTGGCHYSLDCTRYETGCGACPQIGSKRKIDLSRLLAWRKERALPRNLTVVGISTWLSEQAKRSMVLRRYPIRTISNCVDCEEFFAIDKNAARAALGIKTNKAVVLAGAVLLSASHKGFDLFLRAMARLPREKYLLLLFGKTDMGWRQNVSQETRELGYLSDAASLRLAYSSADVFVAPSIMEAFGKTLVESMACGTPVVCFDAGGPRDIVEHHVTGYRARPFDPADLGNGIEWLLRANNDNRIGKEARAAAVTRFDKGVIARQYAALYEELLGLAPRVSEAPR